MTELLAVRYNIYITTTQGFSVNARSDVEYGPMCKRAVIVGGEGLSALLCYGRWQPCLYPLEKTTVDTLCARVER